MPVQINEVIIRAIVSSSPENNEASAGDTDCNADSEGMGKHMGAGSGETADLAEKIFEIIKEKQER
ncbi:MAG: DUF5908 family protein [Chitinophagaceae bacterium]